MRKLAKVHKSIADFRKATPSTCAGAWRQFTLLCPKLATFGRQLVGISSTMIAGVNSRERNIDEATHKERTAAPDAPTAEYLDALTSLSHRRAPAHHLEQR